MNMKEFWGSWNQSWNNNLLKLACMALTGSRIACQPVASIKHFRVFLIYQKQKHATSQPKWYCKCANVTNHIFTNPHQPINNCFVVSILRFIYFYDSFIAIVLCKSATFRAAFSHVSVLIYLWFNTKQTNNRRESVGASRSISDFPSDMFIQREKLRLVWKARKAWNPHKKEKRWKENFVWLRSLLCLMEANESFAKQGK